MTPPAPEITVGITNYNGIEVLPATLASLREIAGSVREVVLVDDGSSDGSPEWVRREYPEVRIVEMGRNTALLNSVRNRALRETTTRFLFLIDNDIVVSQGCVEILAAIVENSPDVMCCTPRLCYSDAPERIYADGGALHFLCLSGGKARGVAANTELAGDPYPTIGGGIMMIDVGNAKALGGFDEGYVIGWGDDGEFHLRARIAGLQVLHVPKAVCLHVERPHGGWRMYGQIYNRYRQLCTCYSTRTLLLLLPILLMFEAALTVVSILKGFAGHRFRALGHAFKKRHEIKQLRNTIQASRKVRDGAVLTGGPLRVTGSLERSRLAQTGSQLASAIFGMYWTVVRRIV